MLKNKTFTANIRAFSIEGNPLPFFNTNTNTKIEMESTNHVLTFQGKDKQEIRRQVAKRVRELQSHLSFGEDYSFYINQIWEKK